jgi:glycosyltransferase involved in cell wall biosynthesis
LNVTRRLRIALTADPYIPVPPPFYGGIERIVHLLAEGLVARGHDVTLFAHHASAIAGVPVIPYGMPPHLGLRCRAGELVQLGGALWKRRGSFDVVHSFGRLAALAPVLPLSSLAKVQSYQRPVPWRGVRRAVRVSGQSLEFTACSASMFSGHERGVGAWHAIHNGVLIDRYRFVPAVSSTAPLVYLGKIEPMKGVHTAIEIASRAGRRLIIAGNRSTTGSDARYFDEQIAPAIDGDRVRYVGPVDDVVKNALLGEAAALLFPTRYPEAFGIVMAESMACGTPVVGFANGGVPEVIRHGTNGFLCDTADEAVAAVARLGEIDRSVVRLDCEQRFSAPVIVAQYEALYRRMTA